jgi:ATP-binding cassette subfamily C (CFTR/MRP) protein 1
MIAKMRGALINLIYKKSTTMSANGSDCSSALTLMSTDIERISSGLRYINDFWASFIEIGLSLWLIYRQLNIAAAAPIMLAFCKLYLCTLLHFIELPLL